MTSRARAPRSDIDPVREQPPVGFSTAIRKADALEDLSAAIGGYRSHVVIDERLHMLLENGIRPQDDPVDVLFGDRGEVHQAADADENMPGRAAGERAEGFCPADPVLGIQGGLHFRVFGPVHDAVQAFFEFLFVHEPILG